MSQESSNAATRKSGKWKWIGGGVGAVAALTAIYWYNGRNNVLSEKPERVVTNEPIPSRVSSVNLRLAIPFTVIQAAANTQLPPAFAGGGNGPDICARVLWERVCVGTRYDFNVERTSDFSVARIDDKHLKIAVGIKASGHGGFRGDGARLLGLDAKSFRAAADVSGGFSLSVKNDWCPDLPMGIGYNWTERPQVEIVGGGWVDIGAAVDGELRKTLDKLPDQLRRAIPCEQIKKAVAQAWKAYAFPIKIENAPPMMVLINPKSLGTSGMIVTEKDIRIVVNATAETSLTIGSTPPSLPDKGPLPPATPVKEGPGRVEIALPVHAQYDALQKAVMEATKEPIRFDIGGKPGQLLVKGIEVYPSGEKLTVGLKFEAKVPGRIFDVSGDVYFTATAVPAEDGQSISLKDVGFSRRLDNSLWNVLSAALEGEVRKQMEKVKLDLKPQIETAVKAMESAISDPARTGGVKLTVTNPKLRVEKITPGVETITAVTLVSANVEGELVSPFK